MKTHTKRPVMILELNNATQAADKAALDAAGLHYAQAIGSYKKIESFCYIVDIGHDGDRFGDIDLEKMYKTLDLAARYSQESVLLVDWKRESYLVYLNSEDVVPLGKLEAVSPNEALEADAWTYANNTYYMARG